MLRILHVLAAVGVPGGVQEVIKNYYQHIDEEVIRFDFAVTSSNMTGFEKNFLNKKSKIHCIVPKKKNIFKHIRQLYKILKSEKYDIVHVHQDYLSWVALMVSWLCGVSVRITHSHSHKANVNLSKQIMISILKFLTKVFATDFFACGIEVAISTYGRNLYNNGKIYIMKNAIETQKYRYSEELRLNIRKEYGLEGKLVVGNVARLSFEKNHELLIDIFEKLYKKNDNYRLVLIGDGENFGKIKRITKEKGIEEAVVMLGSRKDVDVLLNAFDVFVLTSRWEGLPVTLIEAQFNGLPCVVSSVITREVNISDNVLYIEHDYDTEEWIRKIEYMSNEKRMGPNQDLKNEGYDIELEAHKLVEIYNKFLVR